MRKNLVLFYSLICAITSFGITTSCAQEMHRLNVRPDSADIKELVDKYVQSINNADSGLAYRLFGQTGAEYFVHPGGFERGWQQINTNIYGILGSLYTRREWRILHERIWLFECAASVVIEWTMDVTVKKDNSALQLKGKETQLWAKLKGEWKLAQVHDSGIPDTTFQ